MIELQGNMLIADWWYGAFLLLVMVSAGVLGGIASYYLSESEEKSKTKSVVLGIVASLIVPVFLNTISSNLLVEAQSEIHKIFIFSGFCILAAVFSRNFLENIYSKVVQQIGTLEEKLEEVVDEPEEVPAQDVTDALLEDNQLTKDEYILLNTLSSGRYTYRSKSGLRKEAKINKSDFESTLNRLMANKLVAQRQNKKDQVRFFLTGSGREKLGKIG